MQNLIFFFKLPALETLVEFISYLKHRFFYSPAAEVDKKVSEFSVIVQAKAWWLE